MKYKEDWDYSEEAHKKPCKKQEKHDELSSCKDTCKNQEKQKDYSPCKDTCKKIRVINLWKSSSKY
ncbi:hypothetical protein [Priestia megaterium]|uniref:hypothetical protein n=1 Tax=Priestia megaterium TaxID=1404 RepID=UPI00101D08C4|nr:hypothetical protein [Priestia megaterium]